MRDDDGANGRIWYSAKVCIMMVSVRWSVLKEILLWGRKIQKICKWYNLLTSATGFRQRRTMPRDDYHTRTEQTKCRWLLVFSTWIIITQKYCTQVYVYVYSQGGPRRRTTRTRRNDFGPSPPTHSTRNCNKKLAVICFGPKWNFTRLVLLCCRDTGLIIIIRPFPRGD